MTLEPKPPEITEAAVAPSPPWVAKPRRMAHDAEAGGLSRPQSDEAPASLRPESRKAGPKVQAAARSPKVGGHENPSPRG
ncbi:hypothetical protein E2562_004944 [Oryza meyeriana var. granulata]|uniref:Uncharacterized protein n=1 Tax=Oryza meyeriana var. granulata TaxID=110450 RepID=A0A6G1C444_9ORYZ|nr:hypothetical protein E2562_004944 [Oryza meyeriana var. granulata]